MGDEPRSPKKKGVRAAGTAPLSAHPWGWRASGPGRVAKVLASHLLAAGPWEGYLALHASVFSSVKWGH